MLCPKCGADVGDKIQLCDNCEAERQARLQAQREEEELAEERASGRKHRAPERDSDTVEATTEDRPRRQPKDEKEKSHLARKIFLGLLTILALVAIKIVKRAAVVEVTPGILGPATAPGAPVGGGGTTPGAQAPLTVLGRKKSGVKLGNSEIRLMASIAVYHKKSNTMEIAFFRELDEPLPETDLRAFGTIEEVGSLQPDVVLAISFRTDTTGCNLAGISEYRLTAFSREGGLTLPTAKITFPVRKSSGSTGNSAAVALENLECGFLGGDKITGMFRGTRQVAVRDETLNLSWELAAESLVVGPHASGGVVYRSAEAKSTVALWNKAEGRLSIGYFADDLTVAVRERIRRTGGFKAEDLPRPDAIFEATISDGADLSTSSLKTYGMLFYRGRSGGLGFVGEQDEAGIFFVASSKNGGHLEGVQGELKDGAAIGGTYRNSLMKRIGEKDVPFEWDISLNSTVLDTLVASEENLSDERLPERAPTISDERRSGPYGVVQADAAGVEIKSVVSLYYPASGDLAVGFFPDSLNEADIVEIVKRKTMSSTVNQKRAALVMLLDFETEAKEFTPENLLGYTAYFYRDPASVFQFQGYHDAVSFRRRRDQFDKDETAKVSGTVANARIKLRGSGSGSGNSTRFSWDLSYDVQPHVMK